MVLWFTGSRSWFTLKPQVRGTFRHVNQDFCLIFKSIASDLRFCAGSLVPPYRGKPFLNQAFPPGGQGTQKLVRCTNAECRLYGVRVWIAAGSTYTCQCGEPGTITPVAKRHLALAREALKRPTDTTRRPA